MARVHSPQDTAGCTAGPPRHRGDSHAGGHAMGVIDLRSDTVTLPSPEMRRAMFEAEVGDDVYGEDATINALQARAAELLGKEAGLYVTSGTMGNLVAHLAWCRGGDEVICGEASHTLNAEKANTARVAQTQLRTVPQKGDSLDIDAIGQTIRGGGPQWNGS